MSSENKAPGLSVWLIPPESAFGELSKLTTTTFPSSAHFPSSPGFIPHVTLASFPSNARMQEKNFLPSLQLDTLPPPETEFAELATENRYFKRIFLRIKKSETLMSLVKRVRDGVMADSSFDEEDYDPHVSLVYSDEPATEKRLEYVAWKTSCAVGSSKGWKGGKVVLADTSLPVAEWRIMEEYIFP